MQVIRSSVHTYGRVEGASLIEALLLSAVLVLVFGMASSRASAQVKYPYNQDGVNARVEARQDSIDQKVAEESKWTENRFTLMQKESDERFARLENMQQYGLIALFINLIAHVIEVALARERRQTPYKTADQRDQTEG